MLEPSCCGNSSSSLTSAPDRPWMRAMPSPASTTVPTPTLSVCAPKRSICSRRMLAISSVRTGTNVLPRVFVSPAGRRAKRRPRAPLPLADLAREASLQLYQSAAGAAVDQPVAHPRDHAADDGGIHLRRHPYLGGAGERAQPLC